MFVVRPVSYGACLYVMPYSGICILHFTYQAFGMSDVLSYYMSDVLYVDGRIFHKSHLAHLKINRYLRNVNQYSQ